MMDDAMHYANLVEESCATERSITTSTEDNPVTLSNGTTYRVSN